VKSRKATKAADALPSQRKKITLSTGPIRQLPPLDDDIED